MCSSASCIQQLSTRSFFCKEFPLSTGHHFKTEALQVLRFGNVEQNRVVGALAVHMRLAQRAMAVHRGITNGLFE